MDVQVEGSLHVIDIGLAEPLGLPVSQELTGVSDASARTSAC